MTMTAIGDYHYNRILCYLHDPGNTLAASAARTAANRSNLNHANLPVNGLRQRPSSPPAERGVTETVP